MDLIKNIETLLKNNTNWSYIELGWLVNNLEYTLIFEFRNDSLYSLFYVDRIRLVFSDVPHSILNEIRISENWGYPVRATLTTKLTNKKYNFFPHINSMYLFKETA